MAAATAFRTFKAYRHATPLSPEQDQHRRNRIALVLAIVGGIGMAFASSKFTVSDILARFPF